MDWKVYFTKMATKINKMKSSMVDIYLDRFITSKIIIPTINALNYGYCTFDAEWNLIQNIQELQYLD